MKKIITMIAIVMNVVTYAGSNAVKYATTLVAKHEGFVGHVYTCPAGVRTIGYGFTDKRLVSKGTMTKSSAKAELERRCGKIVEKLRADVPGLKDTQYAALCSFTYNLGWTNWSHSTLRKKVIAGDTEGAKAEFLKWNKARVGGKLKTLKGLTKRRTQESSIFGW